MQIKFINSLLIFLFTATQFNSAFAQNGDAESEALSRVVNELTLVKNVVDEAKRKKSNNPQYTFKYSVLEKDIQSIIDGINTHLNRPNRVPRTVEPLKAEYSE